MVSQGMVGQTKARRVRPGAAEGGGLVFAGVPRHAARPGPAAAVPGRHSGQIEGHATGAPPGLTGPCLRTPCRRRA